MIILINQKVSFFVIIWMMFFLSCQKKTDNGSSLYKSGNLNENSQNLNESLEDIQFDISICTPVSGTSNGLKFTGEFIVDTNVYLKMTFTNVSKEKIIYIPPYHYGNQGTKTLAFVLFVVSDSAKKRFTGGGYVSAFRSFWVDQLEPDSSMTYKHKIGKCICSSGNPIPFRLCYWFPKELFEENKDKLENSIALEGVKKRWFGQITTDSSYICCDTIKRTDLIFFAANKDN
ncbi:MAG: hypothetical protein JW915_11360 [Chitinispirillaceae bacterium]|nr:hypothetical protein [Chitinispirillaceae bacterium]